MVERVGNHSLPDLDYTVGYQTPPIQEHSGLAKCDHGDHFIIVFDFQLDCPILQLKWQFYLLF